VSEAAVGTLCSAYVSEVGMKVSLSLCMMKRAGMIERVPCQLHSQTLYSVWRVYSLLGGPWQVSLLSGLGLVFCDW
jgi:hypothetical protein